ncbi:unnamed protein product [Sphagnum balticum]|jgi:hypothetical protein
MGSYLSILNNTSDVWLVKIGPDEAAINIASITSSVVGALALTVATAGEAAPLVASLGADGFVTVSGVSAEVLEAAAGVAAVARGASGTAKAALVLINLLEGKLSTEGFDRLNPGETKQYGKLTLSLWQQGTCIRARVDPANPAHILVERVLMRPIFSGATDNSNLTHDIQFWINKWGIERLNTITLS